MRRRTLYFTQPEQVEVRDEETPPLKTGELLVKTQLSAISSGTEMLAYRGLVPDEMAVDETIASLSGTFHYPYKYGYSSVGEVVEISPGADTAWLGQKVFSFHPHESSYTALPNELLPLPEGIGPEEALFLPNMETAVNFLMDGRPIVGEFAGVFGLGIVGLLTTALLASFPLAGMVCFDRYPLRRQAACDLGVHLVLDPQDRHAWTLARQTLREQGMVDGFDLAFELSGSPSALDQAIAVTGFAGRVVIGSWYGKKTVQLDLGGRFHRSRIRLIGSQVSSLAPEMAGRWSKSRRLDVAWEQVRRLRPSRWITQRFPLDHAPEAYCLLAERPQEAIQVIFTY
jgi:2-desacetyl-2-hydroxyethyl bacteriochlorophyllide A dehydrogenase